MAKLSPEEEATRRFCKAYWAWLRRDLVEEPLPVDFGVDPQFGEAVARQIHIEFEDRVMQKTLANLPQRPVKRSASNNSDERKPML
jgi:hypothetical protein